MKPLRPIKSKAAPAYPARDEQRATSRRGFLRRVALGAVAAGLGGSVLSGCLDGSSRGKAGDSTTVDIALEKLQSVRLPGDGFESVWESTTSYDEQQMTVSFALVLETRDGALADHFRQYPQEGIYAAQQILFRSDCETLQSSTDLIDREEAIAIALEQCYCNATNEDSSGMVSVKLSIDSCEEYWMMGGVAPDPNW